MGQFIALFMDTTLAVIVGLLELLAIGRAVLESNVEWKLLNMEVYLFIAVSFLGLQLLPCPTPAGGWRWPWAWESGRAGRITEKLTMTEHNDIAL